MKNISTLPIALSLVGCMGPCNSDEPNTNQTNPSKTETAQNSSLETIYELPCKITLDADAYIKDSKAEAVRVLETIQKCDKELEDKSKAGLKGILEPNCKPEDTKLYSATPSDLAKEPDFITELATQTNLDYVLDHPESPYNWNARLFECEKVELSAYPSKTGQMCTAIFTEFSHAQITSVSFVSLVCTQNPDVAAHAVESGASTELDLSKVRIGLNPNTVADLMLDEATKEISRQQEK